MQNITIVDALVKLMPGAEFTISDLDLDTLEILNPNGNEIPTQTAIDEAIKQIEAEQAQAELDRATKKAAAEAKLAALGLTADDLKALGLGGN